MKSSQRVLQQRDLKPNETNAWLKIVSRKSQKTASEYRKYLKWFERFLDGKENIGQNDISTFLSTFNGTNRVAIAALKSWLEFSGLNFNYKALVTDASYKRPHKPISKELREEIDEKLS